MKDSSEIILSPEHRKKLEKLESSKTELASLISERDHLENTVRKNLEALYVTKIGINEYDQFKIECEVARLKRKIELFQKMINHGEKFDAAKIDNQLDEEYKKWERQMSDMLDDIERSKKRLGSLMSKEDSIELHNTYRFLVKKLHPDVVTRQTEKSKMLWNRTIEAYERNDLEELKALKLLVDDIKEPDETTAASSIDRNIESVKEKVFSLMEYIKKIKSEFPFTIEDSITDEKWVTDKNASIFKKIEALKDKKAKMEAIIDELILKNMEAPDSDAVN
ncbi:MAG: hypothetical protein JW770_06665 [Actinobacteria bacterium]|nr:hypothetical protein [Actinomycetota bacterium]